MGVTAGHQTVGPFGIPRVQGGMISARHAKSQVMVMLGYLNNLMQWDLWGYPGNRGGILTNRWAEGVGRHLSR